MSPRARSIAAGTFGIGAALALAGASGLLAVTWWTAFRECAAREGPPWRP